MLDLAPLSLSAADWAGAVAAQIAEDIRAEPARHVALFELGLEATRTEALRAELGRWQEAHLRLAEMGCRAVGSEEPALDASVVVAALTGLMLEQLASGREDFEAEVMRPALERLFSRLATARSHPGGGVASGRVAASRSTLDGIAYREAGSGERGRADAPRLSRSPRTCGSRARGRGGAGWRGVAPDLAGFGDSPPDPPGNVGAPRGAVERLHAGLGLGEVALVVHDWGALIGLRWACEHPGAVAGAGDLLQRVLPRRQVARHGARRCAPRARASSWWTT